jgi:acyl-coenzyme A synthetase/AMP-(fatty) acid ligase
MTRDLDPHVADDGALRHRLESEALPANLVPVLEETIARFVSAPTRVHVHQGQPRISWQDLGRMVARAAIALSGPGVGKGVHVGVMQPNVPGSPVIRLAIARLGGDNSPHQPVLNPAQAS